MNKWWVMLLTVLLLLAMAASVAAAPKTAGFVGMWEAIDMDTDGDGIPNANNDADGDGAPEYADGSYMRLSLSAGPKGSFQFNYKDFGASVCGVDEGEVPLYAATLIGTLARDGDHLWGEAPLKCLGKPAYIHPGWPTVGMDLVYDADADILVDNSGVIWQRQGVLDIHP